MFLLPLQVPTGNCTTGRRGRRRCRLRDAGMLFEGLPRGSRSEVFNGGVTPRGGGGCGVTPRLWTASLPLRRPPGQSHHRARQRAGCISHHRATPPDRTGGHHRASNGDQVWGVGRAGGTSWNSLASVEIPNTSGAVRAASGGGPHAQPPTIGEGAKPLCAGRGGQGGTP